MKKLMTILILTLSLVSCQENKINIDDIRSNHKIVRIDGCQYITYTATRGYEGYGYITHKGNCDNQIHKD